MPKYRRGSGSIYHRIVNYYKRWHRSCQAASLPGKIVHDFRRTAVRNMVRT